MVPINSNFIAFQSLKLEIKHGTGGSSQKLMGQSIDIYPVFLSFWGQIGGETSKIIEVNYSVKFVKRKKLLPLLYGHAYYCLNFAAQDWFEMGFF